jgi:hypothetical protein
MVLSLFRARVSWICWFWVVVLAVVVLLLPLLAVAVVLAGLHYFQTISFLPVQPLSLSVPVALVVVGLGRVFLAV